VSLTSVYGHHKLELNNRPSTASLGDENTCKATLASLLLVQNSSNENLWIPAKSELCLTVEGLPSKRKDGSVNATVTDKRVSCQI